MQANLSDDFVTLVVYMIDSILKGWGQDQCILAYLSFRLPRWFSGKESACQTGHIDSVPGSGKSPGGGNGKPVQYSCWEIPRTEEPGGLQSMGSQGVRHNLAAKQRQQQHPLIHCLVLSR